MYIKQILDIHVVINILLLYIMNRCELYIQYIGESLVPCSHEGTELLVLGDGSKHYLCPEHYKTMTKNINPAALEKSV
jgi:hypothetical protein